MLIVGGFRAGTVREGVRTLTESAIGGLHPSDRAHIVYAYAPYLYGQQALIVVRGGTSPETMWGLCAKLKKHNGTWKHYENELWVSRAKTATGVARGSKANEANEIIKEAFKGDDQAVEVRVCVRSEKLSLNEAVIARLPRDDGAMLPP